MSKPSKPLTLTRWHRLACAVSGLLVVAALVVLVQRGSEFFVSKDQRGQAMMQRQQFAEAATTFTDPFWQAIALYRNGDFEQAASRFGGLAGADAAYNQGNALLMQGEYELAIARYDVALGQRPNWQAAQTNREIARGRAERLNFEGGNMTGGELGADDYVFDPGGDNPSDAETETVEGGQEMNDKEMRAIWLRQVQTTPSQFLKSKFAYQRAMEQRGAGNE